MPKSQRKFAI
ncbi:hypothetical protein CGLO_12164 [Colletotrichum gloeosporioides Cg-14]|uniref:Uncharacterized protein n=1 Tax=Colletotrichum gloeosporioides (strain Cg-14) TaxID=1237896 RepID=T0LA78_COLGC|nr:hypothetical protein CGLO_12164 [Colletotrichum gloeosporioides Cg-14]